MMRKLSFVCALSLATLFSVTAFAEPEKPVETANKLVVEGQDLRKAGRDEEALAKFRKAQELAPAPRTLAQVALAEQALGLFPAAEKHLDEALAATTDAWIAKHRQTLEDARKNVADRLGSLDVRTSVPASLVIDGEAQGATPLAAPLRVAVGPHTLVVTAEGFERGSRSITVERGALARESFTLAPVAVVPKESHDVKGPGTPPPPVTVVVSNGGLRTVGWVFVGGGALLGVVSGVSFGLGEKNAGDHNTCLKDLSKNCDDLANSTKLWRNVGLGTAIGGGALLVGGALMVALGAPSTKTVGTSKDSAVACAPALGGGLVGLGCAGRF
jgi:hypothetical protein